MQAKLGDGVIVAGTAVNNAEYKRVGDKETPLCSFGLAVGKRKDTTTIFANCKAWRHLAGYAGVLKKATALWL